MTLVDPAATHDEPHRPRWWTRRGSGQRTQRVQRTRARCQCTATARTVRKTRRGHHHAAAVPVGRKRIPDQRPRGPAARHPGPLHGHRPGTGELRHHRAGPHRPDSQLQAAGPPRGDRRGRGHHASTRRASGSPKPSWRAPSRTWRVCLTSSKRSGGRCNSLKRQAAKARRYDELKTDMEASLRVALSGTIPHAGTRSRQDRAGPESGRK